MSNVYVAEEGNHMIRRISPAGSVTKLAGGLGSSTSGYADGLGTAAAFYLPYGLALDTLLNVYVADWGNNLLRKVSQGGTVITVAGCLGSTIAGYADGVGSSAVFSGPYGVAVSRRPSLGVVTRGKGVGGVTG